MRTLAFLCLCLVTTSAFASSPVGKRFGNWHVVSISSLSGSAGDDASVGLTQGEEPNLFRVDWINGGPVVISMNIENCLGEYDFEASYSVPLRNWLRMSRREVQARLQGDATAWFAQANLSCGTTQAIGALKIIGLNAAASDFYDRLRYFAASESAAANSHR